MTAPHVQLVDVSKSFGGVRALRDISLTIGGGSIHGLVGENGAGKSTLGKVIAGVHKADSGEVWVKGRTVSYRSPRAALLDGIAIIAQEVSLVPERTVLENVFLGLEPGRFGLINRRQLRSAFEDLNEEIGFDIPPAKVAGELRLADQQKVETMRALARGAELIVMDEPTAALSATDGEKLFQIVRMLKARGVTIVYVSHFLEEVLDLADVVTVLKDGSVVRSRPATSETPASLVTGMVGRPLAQVFPAKQFAAQDASVVLEAQGLSRAGAVIDVSLAIRAGEIVGLAGLVGSGRTEVARLLFGADRLDSGRIRINGTHVTLGSPGVAKRCGIAMVPEARKTQGLVMDRSIRENVTLPHLGAVSRAAFVSRSQEAKEVGALLQVLNVRGEATRAAATLSGGNQQKVVFAKWLFRSPQVLIADEPTRGVDVAAKQAIYELIARLAAEGTAILLISSDLEEVLGMAHRVCVMRGGRIVARFEHDATEADVMAAAFALDGGGA